MHPDCEWLVSLHEATWQLASAQDPDAIAERLCQALVPWVADSAAVYLLHDPEQAADPPDRHGHYLAATAAHLPPRPGPWPKEPDHAWLGCERAQGVPAPVLLGEHCAVVPLADATHAAGVAVLTRRDPRASFQDPDLLLAAQLAHVAAIAVHRAHEERRHAAIADTLRRSLRPAPPRDLPGVTLAHRYQPGDSRMLVGGDWFDIIPLSGCRVALVVGDVMGHGLEAAAIMAQLRTAVQTLAALELPPDQVLRSLDDLAGRLTDHSITTCVYAVYDPIVRRCSIASAGHLPPIVVGGDGVADLLDLGESMGLPIGVGRPPIATTEIAAPDGSLLALFTDGLVERRGLDIEHRLEQLRDTIGATGGSLEALADALLEGAAADPRRDDVTLLLTRFEGIPSDRVASWFLEPHTRAPGQVRRLLRRTLHEWGLADLAPRLELLTSELVTNARRHATRMISIRMVWTETVLVEVTDDDHRLPQLRTAGPWDEQGRGLQLVAHLADRWGATRIAGGKTVWFTVRPHQ
ncbi:ATP-binding SpoIIE family protein phosphatase [Thermoactinospora rubra]|uniref:ATP-binding SpoIIE family protein phosphatase n=1 Tax=Thermoactinospora rubra TaxID=1088767 RepID=UPI000A0FC4F7|nr:SpoIIE family protein phosphatase [Thermoactinospora rubra]